ncbi:unnamed protein product [Pylaiella littoralis]
MCLVRWCACPCLRVIFFVVDRKYIVPHGQICLSSERRGTCGETYILNKARSVFCGRVRVSRSFERRHRRGGTRYSRVLSPCHLCRMTSSALLRLCILNKILK